MMPNLRMVGITEEDNERMAVRVSRGLTPPGSVSYLALGVRAAARILAIIVVMSSNNCNNCSDV